MPCVTPGSLSRWLLIGFNQWEALAGDWKVEERRAGHVSSSSPQHRRFIFPFPPDSLHRGSLLLCSNPCGVPALLPRWPPPEGWPASGLWVTPHPLLVPCTSRPLCKWSLHVFSSSAPSAMGSVSGRDSDISTIPVNQGCHRLGSRGFPSCWASATWKV